MASARVAEIPVPCVSQLAETQKLVFSSLKRKIKEQPSMSISNTSTKRKAVPKHTRHEDCKSQRHIRQQVPPKKSKKKEESEAHGDLRELR
jgi:hypothetical protein